ncbi:putative ammonia monooxygenase [Thermanaerovibrio velox DSM 12556]|uniref:Putative ammonia monooxygenase n=2 Tax=Thermanaerovibrio TaxID=81461 RepID=H0UPH8_9BACT|nr:putative ammonia monooxygenase [Thermanaerovibrio velox DSM 12556]
MGKFWPFFRLWMGGDILPGLLKEALVALGVLVFGFLGLRLKIPAGAMAVGILGGLAVKALLGVSDSRLPGWVSAVSQCLVAYVLVRSSELVSFRRALGLLPYAVVYSLMLVGFCVVMALVFMRLCGMDFSTSLFATSPGGLSGVVIAAVETGADGAVTVLFNLCRILCILVILPMLAGFVLNR